MGSPFLHFALGGSHLPENSILLVNRPFSARFSNSCNSLNFEANINFNTTRQNDLKWRKTCIRLKFDLEHFYGPQTKFIRDSLQKHPVFTILYYNNEHHQRDQIILCNKRRYIFRSFVHFQLVVPACNFRLNFFIFFQRGVILR